MRIAFVRPSAASMPWELDRVARAQERELARRGHEAVEGGDPRAEVVHVFHGPGIEAGWVQRLARGAAVDLFLHDGAQAPEDARESLRWADRVIVPSRTHLVRLADRLEFAPDQVRLLEPGLDLELPRGRPRPEPYAGAGPLRLLVLGGRTDGAGLVALSLAVAGLPEGALELILPGPGDPEVDALLAGLLRDRPVRLAPTPGTEELVALAATCHLAVFPSSRPESYALPVDVAVALGLPVWASGAEAALERYGAGALELLPAADPEAWASALAEVLDDPSRSRAAFEALPPAVPTAADAAATLERWDQELIHRTRARHRGNDRRRA